MADCARVRDIADRLQQCYARVSRERMAGVPILNPRLSVEVVGARTWEGKWLGVLVTPWSINLMLLPLGEAEQPAWAELGLGTAVRHRFPAGQFEFLVGEEAEIGRTQMCSLFSPVLEFEGSEAARVAAEAALAALLDTATDDAPPAAAGDAHPPQQSDGRDIDSEQGPADPNLRLSRRRFLSGRMATRGPDRGGERNSEREKS